MHPLPGSTTCVGMPCVRPITWHLEGCRCQRHGQGFLPDGLYRMLTTTLLRLAVDSTLPLDEAERRLLRRAAPNALRPTFAIQAVANDIPPDVVQRLLGQASLQTSSLPVRWGEEAQLTKHHERS